MTLPREVTEEVEGAGVQFPKGSIVRCDCVAPQLDAAVWGSDAMVWMPQRWEKDTAKKLGNLMAWGKGPRGCVPGALLSECQALVAFADLRRCGTAFENGAWGRRSGWGDGGSRAGLRPPPPPL